MQSTIDQQGSILNEFFEKANEKDLKEAMDDRLSLLEKSGHTLVKRVSIGRNDLCPCGSGIKFRKCCINKVNQHEYEIKR